MNGNKINGITGVLFHPTYRALITGRVQSCRFPPKKKTEDKFMSECRSLTNICGNAVAAVIIAKMEGELDMNEFRAALGGRKEHERYLD